MQCGTIDILNGYLFVQKFKCLECFVFTIGSSVDACFVWTCILFEAWGVCAYLCFLDFVMFMWLKGVYLCINSDWWRAKCVEYPLMHAESLTWGT